MGKVLPNMLPFDDLFGECANGDGTFNGVKMMHLLSGLPEEEIKQLNAEAKAKHMAKNAPPSNEEDPTGLLGKLLAEQSAQLPVGYQKKSAMEMTFDPRLAYELALEMDAPLVVFSKYGFDEDAAREMLLNKPFIATVKKYKEEILESGISFKLKAKIQAEDLLTHSYAMAVDPTTPPAVRADMIKWTAKVAGLEPTPSKDQGTGGGGGQFQLNIQFHGQGPAVITPRVIEGEK